MTDAHHHPEPPAPFDRPEFLDGFALIHDAMRRDAGRFAAAVERIESDKQAAAIQRWYGKFRAEVEHHHAREDDVLWPELLRRAPDFADDSAVLHQDHEALDRALADTDGALHDLVGGIDDARRARAVAAAHELSTLLVDHLAREEAAAFPRLARTYTAEEYDALEQQLLKETSLRLMAFELAWVFDGIDPDEVKEMLDGVPAPIRAMRRLIFVPAYRRLAACLEN